ncbi:unnamed protein product [Notodromas monacha]|uniref:Coiled-coil domain-containing protein n=1 Tax=Notodromas monacha TaxID=399045 RepID=A0A7R9BNC6_9CRUS|nr:unnamed protein product [Notodromas monacha]CAG0918690.1 unnamed protein product [Notodromas monacha]
MERKSDTMPQRGKVGQVCQKWIEHEDEALAHQLQSEEITTHYHRNRSRNAQIRQDLPQAKQEQIKEEEEAEQMRVMYRNMLKRQEQRDAELAAKLQHQHPPCDRDNDVGAVGGSSVFFPPPSPVRENEFSFSARDVKRSPIIYASDEELGALIDDDSDISAPITAAVSAPRYDFLSEEEEEEARIRQELEDEELAKRLQEEEVRDMSPSEILERDRIIALEAQDREYARLIYEKEKARMRRAVRERRARKEAERARQDSPKEESDPDRIEVLPGMEERGIDVGHSPELRRRDEHYEEEEEEEEEEESEFIGTSPICPSVAASVLTTPAPPYMPIQGHRRMQAFEKKKKDKGCTHQ